ncbi:hypothetical protein OF117_09835 [Geodermatophilus sp. YIM 151500]|nr:hypothetical protein [Geodermatophilus sp. YIM 151500]MCV2489663.1 hypothetical protein [Geodermatophilus sp. YIM 151500]
MTIHYGDPALDAELAYRRELLQAIGRSANGRRGRWSRGRRRSR